MYLRDILKFKKTSLIRKKINKGLIITLLEVIFFLWITTWLLTIISWLRLTCLNRQQPLLFSFLLRLVLVFISAPSLKMKAEIMNERNSIQRKSKDGLDHYF